MKAIPENAVCVYTDEIHEATTRLELREAQRSLQGLMNAWLDLSLGPCENLNELVMRPEKLYSEAVDRLVQVPETAGPFKLKKSAVLESLDLPRPEAFFAMSKKVRQVPFCASSKLWQVDIDGRVVVNEKEAANLIAAKSIYAGTVEQVTLCREIQKMIDQMNNVNKKLNGELIQGENPFFNNWIRGRFKIWQPACNAPYVISIDPEYLRSKLK